MPLLLGNSQTTGKWGLVLAWKGRRSLNISGQNKSSRNRHKLCFQTLPPKSLQVGKPASINSERAQRGSNGLAGPHLFGSLSSPATPPPISIHLLLPLPAQGRDHCGSAPFGHCLLDKEWSSGLTWTNQSPFPKDCGKLLMGVERERRKEIKSPVPGARSCARALFHPPCGPEKQRNPRFRERSRKQKGTEKNN